MTIPLKPPPRGAPSCLARLLRTEPCYFAEGAGVPQTEPEENLWLGELKGGDNEAGPAERPGTRSWTPQTYRPHSSNKSSRRMPIDDLLPYSGDGAPEN